MYIIIAILIFGLLVGIHEFGHFTAAKLCGVRVNEFALGMGPAIFKKQKGETLYSLRVCPFGGYCAMEGEDRATSDERAFTSKSVAARLVILVAGPLMNFLLGLAIVLLLCTQFTYVGSNIIAGFSGGFPLAGEDGLLPGDKIVNIDGHGIFYMTDFSMYMDRAGNSPVDITVVRDGERVKLKDLPLQKRLYQNDDGTQSERYGVVFFSYPASVGDKIKLGFYEAYDFVRMVWMGISDLITGAAGFRDMAGAVGIVDTISETGKNSSTAFDALLNISYICAFLAVNLAVMNLLPLPALDGGRVFLMLVTWALGKILHRQIDPKYEGYIHTAGLILLLILMAALIVNDVARIAAR